MDPNTNPQPSVPPETPQPPEPSVPPQPVIPGGLPPAPSTENLFQPSPQSQVLMPPPADETPAPVQIITGDGGYTPPNASNPPIPPTSLTPGPVVTNAPAVPPSPRNKKKPLLIGLGGALAVIVLAAAFYFGYYMNSSVILSQSLGNSGKGYLKLINYFNQQSKVKYKGSTGQGSYSIKGDGFTTDGSLNFNSNGPNADANIDIGYGTGRVKAEIRTIKAPSGTAPDVYVKASGISGLDSLIGSPQISSALNQYDGKWLQVDHTLLENLSNFADPTASLSQDNNWPSEAQIVDELNAFGRVNQQYVFTTNKNKAVTVVIKKYGVESVGGHKAYHYTMSLNKDHIKQYLVAQNAALKASKLEPWLKKNKLEADVDSSFKDMESSTKNIKSSDTFDLWADVNTRLIYKIRVNDKTAKNPAANYVDVGLDYKGGSSYPFFISTQSKDDSSSTNVDVVATLDAKTNSVGLKVNYKGTGDFAGSGSLSFAYRPTNQVASISAPSGAIPLSQLLSQLNLTNLLSGSLPAGGSADPQTGNANDAKREADISSLQTQLEAYFSQSGNYPTFTEFNSASWRQANMSTMDPTALKDPGGSSSNLAAKPTANAYSYQVTNSSGGSCESSPSSCTKYTITATLSNGQLFSKSQLD